MDADIAAAVCYKAYTPSSSYSISPLTSYLWVTSAALYFTFLLYPSTIPSFSFL
jgi:hypothetical protein